MIRHTADAEAGVTQYSLYFERPSVLVCLSLTISSIGVPGMRRSLDKSIIHKARRVEHSRKTILGGEKIDNKSLWAK